MNKRPIIILSLVIMILVCSIIVIKKVFTEYDATSDSLSTLNKKDYKLYEEIEIILKKNQDWSDFNINLDQKFKEKYNEKDGLLKDKNVIDAYLDREYSKGEMDFTIQPFIVNIDNKKYRYYIETIGNGNYIEDLKIISVIPLFDKNEAAERQGLAFTNETSQQLLYDMMFYDTGEAGLTKHFREKYPNFDGFFDRKGLPVEYRNYNGKALNKFRIIDSGQLDYENRVLKNICIIDAYRVLYFNYNINYIIDEHGYLDDYRMILVSIDEKVRDNNSIIKNSTAGDVLVCLSGKNRNWQGLPISYSFRQKYNDKDGIFSDLEVDWVEFLCDTIGVKKYPICLHLQDGSIKYYGLIFKLTDTNLIDDIEKIELDVDNNKIYTAEELLKMF